MLRVGDVLFGAGNEQNIRIGTNQFADGEQTKSQVKTA